MNLYRIFRTDKVGYDEYDSAVVAAESEQEAVAIAPTSDGFLLWGRDVWLHNDGKEFSCHYHCWTHPDHVSSELIGTAKEGTQRGVIVASFNAG